MRAYPSGDPIRDVGQQRLLDRLRVRLHPTLTWRTEVPLPIDGDLRAWDAVIGGRGWRVAVEAETVLDDIQAVERRLNAKQRDGGIDHVLLLLAATTRNRQAVLAAPGSFSKLGMRTRDILRALAQGLDPGGCGFVVL
jgi:hypothetical protein